MQPHDNEAIIKYCDELTKNGNNFSITWEGGNDSSWFEIIHGRKRIQTWNETEKALIDLISDRLGYDSFAGAFSTNGELRYNREMKSFNGQDSYSQSATGVKECRIEVRVPEKLWFDEIEINVEVEDWNIRNLTARALVKNGPRSEAHLTWESNTVEQLKKQLKDELNNIDNISAMWQTINIPYRQFQPYGAELITTIDSLEYSFDDSKETSIQISLIDKLNEDETE